MPNVAYYNFKGFHVQLAQEHLLILFDHCEKLCTPDILSMECYSQCRVGPQQHLKLGIVRTQKAQPVLST